MRKSLRLSSIGLAVNDVREPPVRNFRTRFSLTSFAKRVQQLTEEQVSAILKTGFGNLLSVPNHSLSKVLLTELMETWNCEKQAFVLDSGEIRMTLLDAALILGLRVFGKSVVLREEEPFSELEELYGATKGKRKVDMKSLEERLDSIGGVMSDEFVRTFLLYTIGTFLSSNGKVDSRYLLFLEDLDEVCEFAWGAAVVEDLAQWLDKRKENNVQYVGGCLIFLQIWSFEHFDIARPQLQGHDLTFPRVCRWDNSKPIQRQKLTLRFKDLNDDQVIWTLQPTSSELQLEIIKEALGVLSDSTELESAENSLASTSSNVHEVDSESQLSISSKVHREEDEYYPENLEVEDNPKKSSTSNREYTEQKINLANLIVLDTPPNLRTCNTDYREQEINLENQVVEDTSPKLNTYNGKYEEMEILIVEDTPPNLCCSGKVHGQKEMNPENLIVDDTPKSNTYNGKYEEMENLIVEDTPPNLSCSSKVHGQKEMNPENLIVDDTPTSTGIIDEVTSEQKFNEGNSTQKLSLSEDELRKRNVMLEEKVGQVMEKNKQFEEEIAELKKELDRLREENRGLRLYSTFADEFERHLLDYETN
ncbi:uncharacterized protein [Arachis hypogaea]|uniref:Aminotransferase-like plant mobile domain-containing protein n=1 Tax=Arachis hypogaea TaxID=3818 RepID=A0A445CUF2_ARAHY|nr:uncharacterized protein LOC112697253 [Arachis hypogaea]QHO47357.1 hypothetical protein DS421_6g195600 [Arachis hypogaea]RYR54543.1 hypothetical protein Ahy_A06g029851 [Arachis hypogaea]